MPWWATRVIRAHAQCSGRERVWVPTQLRKCDFAQRMTRLYLRNYVFTYYNFACIIRTYNVQGRYMHAINRICYLQEKIMHEKDSLHIIIRRGVGWYGCMRKVQGEHVHDFPYIIRGRGGGPAPKKMRNIQYFILFLYNISWYNSRGRRRACSSI